MANNNTGVNAHIKLLYVYYTVEPLY